MRSNSTGLRMMRYFLVLTLSAVIAAIGPSAESNAEESAVSQYALEAAYLSKFGAFVEWPATVLPAPDSPIVLCILGTDPFGDGFEKSLDGKSIGARPLKIKRVKSASREAGCNIFYIAASEARQAQMALDVFRGAPVLTITDALAPGNQGEIIHFIINDERVRFDIDDESAAAGGLTISSRLLSLAVSIKARK